MFLGSSAQFVRDIHEVYRIDGDMIYVGPMWCILVLLNTRRPVSFVSWRFVLYLESTIIFFNSHYSSERL